jgi:hypothetical protein
MPSANITALTDYAGGQAPVDLAYIGRSPFGPTDDRKTTLNDLFSFITKNITDGAVRFSGTFAPAVSAANAGALYYNDTTDTFQGSRNGSAYDNLIFGAGANQRVAFYSSLDTISSDAEFLYLFGTNSCRIVNGPATPSDLNQQGFGTALTTSTTAQTGILGNAIVILEGFATAASAKFQAARTRDSNAAPQSGDTLFTLSVGGSNLTVPSATMTWTATQNWTSATSNIGTGLSIASTPNGSSAPTQRIMISSAGVVALGNTQALTQNFGTNANVVLGALTTYDNNAATQIGVTGAGLRTLVVQAGVSQTIPIIEQQQSDGTRLHGFYPDRWQVQAEATTDPDSTQLTAGNHFAIYRKNDQFVIAYNDAGTITYLTIPLDGATTTWTQTTTPP